MAMKRMVAQESTAQKDEEIIISIVKEMTESMTGAQSTRHWAEDALWFDIPPFASRGIQPALKLLDRVFGNFQSCKVDIVETDVVVNGDMGLVCTVQRVPEIASVRSPSRRCSTFRSGG
jgi:ketosteroid isomerase-like protein